MAFQSTLQTVWAQKNFLLRAVFGGGETQFTGLLEAVEDQS